MVKKLSKDLGQNLFYEGDREKGIHGMNEGIDLMAKTDRSNTDHLIHGYLNMLASMYGAMKDYDHALATNERNLQLTMEGTRWGADFIVDYMKKRGRYPEAVTIYNDLIERVRQQGDTLGEMMNTTKWGLAEVYRKMGNCEQTAVLYEQVLRLEHAAHLLVDEPERTIAQVAADCGFGSSAYFSDRFRQHYGMSPSDFRIEATKYDTNIKKCSGLVSRTLYLLSYEQRRIILRERQTSGGFWI